AIFSLSNLRLRLLEAKFRNAHVVRSLLNRPTRTLSTIVSGNMLVNIGLSSLLTAICVPLFGNKGLFLAILISGTLILFLGEIFPKTISIYLAERVSIFSAPALLFFSKLLAPLVFLVVKIVDFFSSFLPRRQKPQTLSGDELKTALLLSRRAGYISASEEGMINYVLEFKDTWVSEIVTPRIEVHGIDTTVSRTEVVKILKETKHSKLPVYEGSLDNIVGVIYAKDVFLNPGRDYHELLREPILVPESKRIDDLLKVFLENNERIAVVVDEYGGTTGVVTLEDIEEEIFGEIYDEFETPKEYIEKVAEYTYRVGGKAPVKTVNLELKLDLPQAENTLAGFLLSYIGKIPRAGEQCVFNNIKFTIEKATAKKITSVIIAVSHE
ncbi:MAG: hemolysin family protein, partial [Candidatus Omnitrophica bacterium]|nr:hemolysin family protein [Candidatus Omnitrophota bacterium]